MTKMGRLMRIRPWAEFFKADQFNKPDPHKYSERLSTNVVFYRGNYLVVLAVCLIYVFLTHWAFFIAMMISAGVGYYMFGVRRGGAVVFAGRPVSRRELVLSYLGITLALFLFFGGLESIAWSAVAGVLVFTHASFRVRSLKARGTRFVNVLTGARPPSAALREGMESDDSSTDDDGDGDGEGDGYDPENPRQEERLQVEQARFRSHFRAQMRAKYSNTRQRRR